jgi:predicted TIM-barrel fold metal-dependent hydrolase
LNKRRAFLIGGGATVAAAAGLAAWRFWPEQGFWNPCLIGLPRRLVNHELVKAAWEGLRADRVWDAHSHLVGVGDSSSGIYVNPRMESVSSPQHYARRLFFLNAGCAYRSQGGIDEAYVARILNLMDAMKRGVKLVLFAFDRAHGADGKRDLEHTSFYIPDAYVRETARAHPRYFEWACSIHPYRADCVQALEQAKADGARAVKWLPAAMGIDPASPKCDRFYAAAARLGMPITSHAGLERAVLGGEQEYGNPLRLRRALDAGVRVVVAHCASLGQDRDLDKGESGPPTDSFSLFSRLMDDRKYEKHLYGDISAMTQVNRAGPALVQVIERTEWHARLLNGSDYPLPGIMPLFSVDYMVQLGLLPESAAPVLKEIRGYNPLLFDFVMKRNLRSNGKALAAGIFETRSFFEPPA